LSTAAVYIKKEPGIPRYGEDTARYAAPMAPPDKKKQIPLRLSDSLHKEIAAWAEEDFRSINGQIEFLLTECVRKRKKQKPAP